jgi:hypothetical protein
MSDSAANLEQIQRWFHASITHPNGSRDGSKSAIAERLLPAVIHDLDDIVLASKSLNSTERLSIYANMYFDRLIDILAEEFPSVRHLLKPQNFAEVAKRYITRHPSTHYSLAQFGKAFPKFLLEASTEYTILHPDFAAAVATVERTMEDVFDEEQVEPLSFDELQAIPLESWPQMRLNTNTALRLLELPYPVNDYINAVRDSRSIEIPNTNRSFVIVYRFRYQVWRMDLDEHQYTLLSALHKGRTLAEALSVCAELPGSEPTALAESLHDWFRRWTAEGFFHKVEQ